MKKLIGVLSAVFFILAVTGPAFANEFPLQEAIEQETLAIPEGEEVLGEETATSESQGSSDIANAEIPAGAEATLAVWGSRDNETPAAPATPSHIDTVKVDLSVDDDGQTFMPRNE
ncbi:MAG: hypothetical protein OEZ51_08465 [Nitrospinota bacterium]|nr:hypothetical protein [Nitrospinota bacterium]